MKKYSLLMLIAMSVSLSWSQAWNKTFGISSTSVTQVPISNSMVQVASPSQIWTVTNDHVGGTCGDGIWLHGVNSLGNVINSTSISQAAEVNIEAFAIEEFFGDLFVGGSSKNCVTGAEKGFIMSLSNSGSFVSAFEFTLGDYVEVMDIVKLPSSQFMAIGFTGSQNQNSHDPFSIVFDQALNILSAQVYQIPGDNVPIQAVLNASGSVSIVGTEIGPSGYFLFTMDLATNGSINGPYMTYFNGVSTDIQFPSICLQGTDLLVSATMGTSGQTDIVLLKLDGSTRNPVAGFPKYYNYSNDDHSVQVFDENGNITIAYRVQNSSGIQQNGLLFLNSSGNVSGPAELYSNYNFGGAFASIQSSGMSPDYFMGANRTGFGALQLAKRAGGTAPPCASTVSFVSTSTFFTTSVMPLQSSSFVPQATSFFTNTVTGFEYDCAGAGTGTFKKDGPTSIAENGTNEMGLEVYPTVSSDQIHFELEEAIDGVANIYSMQGKLLYSETFKDGNGNLSIAGFTQGQYILEVNSNKGAARRVISKL